MWKICDDMLINKNLFNEKVLFINWFKDTCDNEYHYFIKIVIKCEKESYDTYTLKYPNRVIWEERIEEIASLLTDCLGVNI